MCTFGASYKTNLLHYEKWKCWRCGQEKEHEALGCCVTCSVYLHKIAKKMYTFGIPYTPKTSKTDKKWKCWRCGSSQNDVIK